MLTVTAPHGTLVIDLSTEDAVAAERLALAYANDAKTMQDGGRPALSRTVARRIERDLANTAKTLRGACDARGNSPATWGIAPLYERYEDPNFVAYVTHLVTVHRLGGR